MDFHLILVSSLVLFVNDKTRFACPVVSFVSFRDFTDVVSVVFIDSMVLKLDLNCRHFMLC
jgi:hypothetical protein